MNSFTFNGKSSADFGLYISEKKIYSIPARDVTFHSVPGRSGDVLIDNDRYENVTVSYTVGLKNIKSNIHTIKSWLCKPGYLKLTDTYQPSYFRYACFCSAVDVVEMLENFGTAQITFNCKPFMYLNSGQTTKTFTGSGVTLNNPCNFESYPLIRIYGSGAVTLTINNKSYSFTQVSPNISCDSELMNCYYSSTLKNNVIGFTEFPVLEPGDNTITYTGSVTKIMITPRWRTL